MKHPTIAAAVFGAAWMLAGCVTENPPPAPPPTVEVIPKPPVSPVQLVWEPGHWDWTGNGYVWVPGRYVPLDGHGTLWMPGYWEKTASGWVWHPAHWVV